MTVKHRGGAPAKPTIDLTKKAAPVMSKPPQAKLEPKQQQPRRRQYITAAADGPPIAAELPEKLHKNEGRVHKTRNQKQGEILGQIIEKAGDGIPRSLGLRLVLAASEHKYAAAWPIGLLAKAFHVSGRSLWGFEFPDTEIWRPPRLRVFMRSWGEQTARELYGRRRGHRLERPV